MNQNTDQPASDDAAIHDVAGAITSTSSQAEQPAKLPFKKRLAVFLASLLGTTIIRTLAWTLRYRVIYKDQEFRGRQIPQPLLDMRGNKGEPLLFALCHGSCFPILSYWRDRGMCVVTSRSTDGQILARILRGLGCTTVNGSSSRGGTRALIDLTHIVRQGADAAIAIDGPRGPAEQAKPGIILLAKLTGRPIIPLASTSRRFYRFQSWDRFRLPFPFTRAVIIGGDPIYVPADASHELIEQKRLELEQTLRSLQQQVDAREQPRIWKLGDSKRTKRRDAMAQKVNV